MGSMADLFRLRSRPGIQSTRRSDDDSALRRVLDRLLECNSDYRNTVFVAGAGRSGTSWLAEILNYDNRYRYIFEPFQARYVHVARAFHYGLYLRPTDANSIYLEPARQVMAGNVRHRWCDRYNKRLFARQRLIKEVRANLWLKWLRNHFPGIPMFLLMRHPFAVAASRRLLDWPPRSRVFFMQEALLSDYPGDFWKEFKRADSPFERFIFDWAVQHYVPLQQFSPGDFHYVFYEDLCTRPEAVAHGIFAHLGRTPDDVVFDKLWVPSETSRDGSPIRSHRTREELISAWRTQLTRAEIERGLEILAMFGLNRVYDEECMPRTAGIERFIALGASSNGVSGRTAAEALSPEKFVT